MKQLLVEMLGMSDGIGPSDAVSAFLPSYILRKLPSTDPGIGRPVPGKQSAGLEEEEVLLFVPVTMDGKTMRMAVDTGSHLTLVYQHEGKTLPLYDPAVHARRQLFLVNG